MYVVDQLHIRLGAAVGMAFPSTGDRSPACVAPFPLVSSVWSSWRVSVVTFPRYLCSPVASGHVMLAYGMLSGSPATTAQRSSVVAFVK